MNAMLLVSVIFAVLLLLAASSVCWPIVRARTPARGLKAAICGGVALFILAAGGGLYLFLGSPGLALRTVSTPQDVPSLIAALSRRAREKNFDATGWTLLGRGYLSLGDPADAAAAFRRAVLVSPVREKPALLSAYGEALTSAASGTVTPDAEAAFRSALAGNPRDSAGRYYLGLADAARGKTADAIALWKSLLADSPPGAPWRAQLLDHIAALEGASGAAPDISAMVARLANRLQTSPNDPEGWQRLVRAYTVLGERDRARSALVTARHELRGNPEALAALDDEAKQLKLE